MIKESAPVIVDFTPEAMEHFEIACKFIRNATPEQCAMLVNEVMMFHHIFCFNEHIKSLDSIKSVDVNGSCIQLTTSGN